MWSVKIEAVCVTIVGLVLHCYDPHDLMSPWCLTTLTVSIFCQD